MSAILEGMREDDLLMITADHGCDPGYKKSTDHSREYTPFIMCGRNLASGNIGTRSSFADIGATILDYFNVPQQISGKSIFL